MLLIASDYQERYHHKQTYKYTTHKFKNAHSTQQNNTHTVKENCTLSAHIAGMAQLIRV
jgi:hypothetical protein